MSHELERSTACAKTAVRNTLLASEGAAPFLRTNGPAPQQTTNRGRVDSAGAVAAAAVALLLGACRFSPTSPAMATSPAGRPCPQRAVVANAEDGDNQVVVQDGRSGYIYTYVDSAGSTVSPAVGAPFAVSDGGAAGTQKALRIQGQLAPRGLVYAALGFNFTNPRGPYDMSRYLGVSFYARRGPGSTGRVRMKMPDQYTDSTDGKCAKCANDFGIDLRVSEQWQKFIIPFSQLRQQSGWGVPRPWSVDTQATYAMHFQVSEPGMPFDLWVDEIAFTGCQP